MPEIPEEARCFADPEKECPLRAAVHAVRQAESEEDGERMSAREYDAVLEAATAPLSKVDLIRFFAMTDASGPKQDIRPGTCQSGAYRGLPLVGKMTCSAAAVHYVYRNERKSANTGTNRHQTP